jgi:hypothetical protein
MNALPGVNMLSLLIALLTIPPGRGFVAPVSSDFDAVWVPAGVTGPIVAGPWDGAVFEVVDGD